MSGYFIKKLRRVDLPAPMLPSTVMVKGRPEEWSRRTSEVGKGMLKVPGAPEAKLRMQVVSRKTDLIIFELFLCLSGSIEKN